MSALSSSSRDNPIANSNNNKGKNPCWRFCALLHSVNKHIRPVIVEFQSLRPFCSLFTRQFSVFRLLFGFFFSFIFSLCVCSFVSLFIAAFHRVGILRYVLPFSHINYIPSDKISFSFLIGFLAHCVYMSLNLPSFDRRCHR